MKLPCMILVLGIISNSLYAAEQHSDNSSRANLDNIHALAGYNHLTQGNQGNQGSLFNFGGGTPLSLAQINISINSLYPNKSEAELNAEKERIEREINIYNEGYNKKKSKLMTDDPDLSEENANEIAGVFAEKTLKKHRDNFNPKGIDLVKTAAVVAIVVLPIAIIGGTGIIVYNSVLDKETKLGNDLDDRIKNIHERVFQNAQILVDGYRESGIFDGMTEEERGAEIRRIFEEERTHADLRVKDLKARYDAARNGFCTIM